MASHVRRHGLDPAPKGLDPFDVDKIYLIEMQERWARAGDEYSHGTANFRLDALFNQAKQVSKAFARTQGEDRFRKIPGGACHPDEMDTAIDMKMREPILPAKRRILPKGGEDESVYSEGERLVRKPGAYLTTEASIRIRVQMHRPHRTLLEDHGEEHIGIGGTILDPKDDKRLFTRATFSFEYRNVPMLNRVNAAIDAVNTAALENIHGSLRSYQLTEEEVNDAKAGILDIVGGFTIIDDDCRMVVIEGLPETVGKVVEEIVREKANDNDFRVLSNLDIRFRERLYTEFNVDLKKIRLREPLPILCKMPEIYNRTKVTPDCFEALDRLHCLRKANRVSELAEQSLFPLASQLLQVESKYGESVSNEDIYGVVKNARTLKSSRRAATGVQTTIVGKEAETAQGYTKKEHSATTHRRKAATDANNDAYLKKREQSERERQETDFQKNFKAKLAAGDFGGNPAKYEDAKTKRLEERAADPVPAKFVYSGQKLQYSTLKQAEMRAHLGREKNCHFTYSKDFLSAAMSMVDASMMEAAAEKASKAKWKTQRGFVYPAPKNKQEYAIHPNKPSESRIDLLAEPWVENENVPRPVQRDTVLKEGQPDFDSIPVCGGRVFGGLRPAVFEREYDNNHLGNPARLPRGHITLEPDKEFYRSVHLCGDEVIKAQEEAKREEERQWLEKVVVDKDQMSFQVGGFNVRARPTQLGKTEDIVRDPVQKKSIRIVRNARLPSGKKVPLRVLPYSAFSRQEYEDPRDFTVDLRKGNVSSSSFSDVT